MGHPGEGQKRFPPKCFFQSESAHCERFPPPGPGGQGYGNLVYEDIYTKLADSLEELKAKLKEKEALEWKAQTKREEDSLELVLKEKVRLKSLTNKDSLVTLIKRDSMKIKDLRLEQSIEEIEDLIEPISDSGNELQ